MAYNRYEMTSVEKINEKEIIYQDDYMYPIFEGISSKYTNSWNKDGFDTWSHYVGTLYKLKIMGPYTWIEIEFPEGLEINISEDGHIENRKYSRNFHLQVPEDWDLIKMNINNKEIEIRKKNR